MASIIGGIGAGTLDSSLYLLNRQDRTNAGTAGAGEDIYVNVANGGLILQHADAWLPSRGDDFLLVRTYNSSGRLTTANKWSLAASLDVAGASAASGVGTLILYNADGSDFTFKKNAGSTNTYTSVDGAGSYQTIVFDGTNYVLTRSDQAKLTFNSTGQLTRSQDTNGVAITYTYTSGKLTTVQDDTGHTVTYNYTGNNLMSLTDATGTVLVSYGYDGSGRLTSSTDRSGRTTVYRYDASGLLSGIDLPREVDKLLINGGIAGAPALAGADAQYYLDWRKRLGVVDANGNGKTAATLTAANINTLSRANGSIDGTVGLIARTFTFEYTTVNKGAGNDTKALSALVDMIGGRTEFAYSFTTAGGNYAGGTTKMTSALGMRRMKSNDDQYVLWRTQNGYYATWSQAAYDAGGVFAAQANAINNANSTTYTFNASGAIRTVLEPTGLTTIYEYDANENLTKIIGADADGITKAVIGDSAYYRALRKSFGAAYDKPVAQLSGGEISLLKARFTTNFAYDQATGNLLSQTDGEGNKTSFTYTTFNKVETQIAAMGNALAELDTAFIRQKRTELGFPANLSSLTSTPGGHKDQLRALYTTTYIYSQDGKQNLLEIRSPSGGLTKFSNYDVFGNAQTKTVYTDSTDLVTVTKQLVTTYLFDAFGNNTRITSPDGGIVNMTYDRFGNVLTRTDAKGGITTFTYDGANRLLTVTDAEGNYTFSAYDAVGNRVAVSDAKGHLTYFIYDQNNLLVTSRQLSTNNLEVYQLTNYFRDANGNVTQISAANGSTFYRYDEAKRLVEVTTPAVPNPVTGVSETGTIKYEYDGAGHQVLITDQRGYKTQYLYNGVERVIQTTDAVNNVVKYTYDSNLNQLSVVVGAQLAANQQRKTSVRYDEADQVVAETDAMGAVTSYAYDDAGRKVKMVSALADALLKSNDPYYIEYRKSLNIVYPAGHASAGQGKLVVDLTLDNGATSDKTIINNAFTTDIAYSFTASGLLITETAPTVLVNGVSTRPVTKHQFDKNGNEIVTTNANTRATTYTFDKLNRVIMVTDENSVKTVFSYDSRGNKTSVIIGATATVNASTGKIDVTSTEGAQVTTYAYNEFNNLIAVTDGVGNALASSDADLYVQMRSNLGYFKGQMPGGIVGKLVADLTDAEKAALRLLYTTSYQYDSVGNRTKVIDANGTVTDYAYDAQNRLSSVTEAVGTALARTVSYGYDAAGNRTKVTSAVGNMIVTAGAAYGDSAYYTDLRKRLNVTKVVNGATVGKAVADLSAVEIANLKAFFTQTFEYDGVNRLTESFDEKGIRTHRIYDNVGNLTEQWDNFNDVDERIKNFSYDLNNRLLTSVENDPSSMITSYQYDALGNRIKLTDARGNATRFVFDALSRQIKAIDPLNAETKFEYDAVGNQVKITDAKAGVTQFLFDFGNRLTQITDAENRVTKYTLDSRGNRITQTTAFGVAAEAEVTTFEYDAQNHLVAVIDAAGVRTTTNYDRDYNVVKVTDANGNATSYGFDALNRRITVTDVNLRVVTYGFDANDNQITITDSRNAVARVSSFYYDQRNQVVIHVDAEGNRTEFEYNEFGERAAVVSAMAHAMNTNEAQYYRDMRANLGFTDADGNGLLASALSPAQKLAIRNIYTTTYEYDNAGRMMFETNNGTRLRYDRDSNNNLWFFTDKLGNVTRYDYDANNRLIKVTDALNNVTEYRYDAVGNRTQVIDPMALAITTQDDLTDQVDGIPKYYQNLRRQLGFVKLDANGNPVLDAAGNKIGLKVSELSAAQKTALIGLYTTTSYYDKTGKLLWSVDPQGYVTKYLYDKNGNLTSQTLYSKALTTLPVDPLVVPAPVATPTADQTVSFKYDKLNRVTERKDGEGYITKFVYDNVGNVLETHQALDTTAAPVFAITRSYYDKLNREIWRISPEGYLSETRYDAVGNVLTTVVYDTKIAVPAAGTMPAPVTGDGWRATAYQYSKTNQLTRSSRYATTSAASLIHTDYLYDANGNKITVTEAVGTTDERKTSYIYNVADQLAATVDAAGTVTVFVRDAQGNVAQRYDAYGTADQRLTDFNYDKLNRQFYETNAEGSFSTLSYDASGNLTRETYAYGRIDMRSSFYTYDRNNRQASATNAAGETTSFTYDAAGNRASVVNANFVPLTTSDAEYYRAWRKAMNVIDLATGEGMTVAQLRADAAAMAKIVAFTTTSYTYNRENRLVKEVDGNNIVTTYTYDGAGNQKTMTLASGIAAQSRLTTYNYDKDNNLTSVVTPLAAGINGTTSYEYNVLGKIVKTTDADGGVTTSSYDMLGRLTATTDRVGNALAASDANLYLQMRKDLGYTKVDGAGNTVALTVLELTDAQKTALRNLYTERYTYDRRDNLLTTTDHNGTVTSTTYDVLDRVTSFTEALGTAQQRKQTFEYDVFGNQTKVTDAVGHTVVTAGANYGDAAYYTDLRKRLGYTKVVNGLTVGKAVIDLSVQEIEELKAKFSTVNHYDQMDRLIDTYRSDGAFTTFEYDKIGNLKTRTEGVFSAEGERKTTYTYDLANRLKTQTTHGSASTVSYEYDALGNRVKITDGRGYATRYLFDALSRNIKVIDPLTFETKFEYDAVGNQVKIIDAKGGITQFAFDLGNRMIQLTDAENRVTKYTFDNRSNRITQTTAFGVAAEAEVTTFEYDAENHLVAVTDAAAVRTATTYDRDYNRTKVTDANGNATTYGFDALNRNITVTDANLRVVTYAFDANDNQITITDSRNAVARVTSFAYDQRHQQVIHTDAEGYQTLFSYNTFGEQATLVDPMAYALRTSDVQYYRDMRRDMFGYFDAQGNGVLAANLTDEQRNEINYFFTTKYEYDSAGRLHKESNIRTSIIYDYDQNNNQVKVTDRVGEMTWYEFDANNRVVKITDWMNNFVEYGYDANGNRNRVIDANASLATSADDAQGVPGYYRELRKQMGFTKVVNGVTVGLNANELTPDQKTKIKAFFTTTTYYDKTGKLLWSVDPQGYVTKYLYDKNGNLTSQTLYSKALTTLPVDPLVVPAPVATPTADQTVSFKYDKLNRVTERKDGEGYITKFVYDNVGNVLETHQALDTTAAPVWAITRNYYDKLNREIWRISPEGYLSETRYDAVGNVTHSYVYDTKIAVPAAGQVPAPVSGDSWHATLYQYDKLNSTIQETRYFSNVAAGAIVTKHTLDANGNTISTTEAFGTADARTTTYTYNSVHQLVKIVDAMGVVTVLNKDGNDNIIARFDAVGTADQRETQYHYYNGRLTYEYNAEQVGTNYQYDAAGNLIARSVGFGYWDERKETFTYDRNNRLSAHTIGGNTTKYTYDGAGNQTSMINANLSPLTTLNDAWARGGSTGSSTLTDYYRNARQRLGVVYKAGDAGATAANLGQGKFVAHLTPADIDKITKFCTISYVYDRDNRLVQATDANGVITKYTYDGAGNKKTTVQAVGLGVLQERTTKYDYDKDNRLTKVTDPMGFVTSYDEYDVLGNVTKMTDAKGNKRENTYDKLGRLLTSIYGGATAATTDIKVVNTYDLRGNLKTATQSYRDGTDPRTTTYFYDLLDRQTRITDAEGFSTSIEYDAFGNQTKVTNGQFIPTVGQPGYDAAKAARASNLATSFTYDEMNRMETMTTGTGDTTLYGYDARGNRTSVTEAYNSTTTAARSSYFEYDAEDRLIAEDSPLSARIVNSIGLAQKLYTYDGIGNKIAESSIQSYGTYIVPQGATNESILTDLYGILPSDPHWGDVYLKLYGSLSQASPDIFPYGGSLDIPGLPLDNLTYAIEGDDFYYALNEQYSYGGTAISYWMTNTFEYDSNRNLTAKVDSLGARTEYFYDAMGNKKQIKSAAGSNDERSVWMEYDLNNRKTADLDGYSKRTSYQYDKLGNRTKVTNPLGKSARFYYDNTNNLTTVLDAEGIFNTFKYDAGGNRTEERVYQTKYAGDLTAASLDTTPPTPTADVNDRIVTIGFNKANQMVSRKEADGTLTKFSLDGSGKTLTETLYANLAAASQRSRVYKYDAAGRLETFTDVDGTKTTFTYDAANNRLSETVYNATDPNPTRKTRFAYDLNNRRIAEIVSDGSTITMDIGFGDRVVESQTVARTNFFYDLAGNVIATERVRDSSNFWRWPDKVELTYRTYDQANRLKTEINPTNEKTSFDYDKLGNLTKTYDNDNNLTTQVYDLNNRLVKEMKPLVTVYTIAGGEVVQRPTTVYTYDDAGRLVQTLETVSSTSNVTDLNSGFKTTRWYDANDRLIGELNADNALCTYSYYASGELKTKTEYMTKLTAAAHTPATFPNPLPTGEARVTSYEYDLGGRLKRTTLPSISVTTVALVGGQPSSTTSSMAATEIRNYDAFGDEVETIDRAGNRSVSYYDKMHRKVAAVDALGHLVEWVYDSQGNQLEQRVYVNKVTGTPAPATYPTKPAGIVYVTNRQYDIANRLVKEILPEIQVFDPATETTSLVRPTTQYILDQVGNVTWKIIGTGPQAVTEHNFYDAANRLVATLDGNRVLQKLEYDDAGNISKRTRYYGTLPAGVDLAFISHTASEVAGLVSAVKNNSNYNAALNQVIEYEYDGMHRLLKQTDMMSDTTNSDNLVQEFKYDAAGNRTYVKDEDGYIAKNTYDSKAHVTQTIAQDGNKSFFEYDAAGNLTRAYTGDIATKTATAATSVNVDLVGGAGAASTFNISWQVANGTQQSWVVWDTAARASIASYRNSSSVQVNSGTTATMSASIAAPAAGAIRYFRIVSKDAVGNLAWTAEQAITVPPRPTGITVSQTDAGVVVTAVFDAAVPAATLPTLLFGQPGNLNLSSAFALKAGTTSTYTATMPGFNLATMGSYKVSWKDAAGISYSTTENTFVRAGADATGVNTSITNSTIIDGSTTTYKTTITTTLPPVLRGSLSDVLVRWRVKGSNASFDEIMVPRGPGSSVTLVIGEREPLAAGIYDIVLVGLRNDGSTVTLDVLSNDTALASNSSQAVSWTLPSTGTDQILVVGGSASSVTAVDGSVPATTHAFRQDGRLFNRHSNANVTYDYLVYYGTRFSSTLAHKHTLNATGTMNAAGTSAAMSLQLTMHSAEVATMAPGSLFAAIVSLGTGTGPSVITTTPIAFTGSGTSYTAALGNLTKDTFYALEVYYTDTQGRKVVVERRSIQATGAANAAVNAGSFNDWSLIVTGRETGTAARSNGIYNVTPSLYTGPINAALLQTPVRLTGTGTANGEGTSNTTVEQAGYYTDYQYNALNYKVGSNESDGVWREFGVNANGNVVQTTTFETGANGVKIAGGASTVAYTEVDARGRTVTQYDPATVTTNSGVNPITQRPITKYTYDVLDRVLTKAEPGVVGASGQALPWKYDYNALGMQTKATNPSSQATTTWYDQFGNAVAVDTAMHTANDRHRTLKFYDKMGNLTKEVDALNNVTTHTYDLFNRKLTDTDDRGNDTGQVGDYTTSYTYDHRDRLVKIEQAQIWHLISSNEEIYIEERKRLGLTIETGTVNLLGEFVPDKPRNLRGKQTIELTNDEIAAIKALYTVNYEYDGRGNRTVTSLSAGSQNQTTIQVFDGLKRVTDTQTATTNAPTYTRTLMAVSSNTSGVGFTNLTVSVELTQAEKDSMSTDPSNGGLYVEYRNGNQSGSFTKIKLDGGAGLTFSKVLSNLLYSSTQLRFTYTNKQNEVVTIDTKTVDNTKKATKIGSRALGTITGRTVLTHSKTTYDAYGNVKSQTDAENRTKTQLFGSFGRLSQSTDEDGNIVGFEYDNYGRVKREYTVKNVVDASSKNITRTYDDFGRLMHISDAETVDGVTTTTATKYSYTLNGLRAAEVITRGADIVRDTGYSYDFSGRMTSWTEKSAAAKDAASRIAKTTVVYDAEGNRTEAFTDKLWDPNGVNADNNPNYRLYHHVYAYDNLGRLRDTYKRTIDKNNVTTNDLQNHYNYDGAGNRDFWRDSTGARVDDPEALWSYVFDANNRVAQATATVKGVEHKQIWSYDARGNVVSQFTYKKVNGAFALDDGQVSFYNSTDRAWMMMAYTDGHLSQVTTTTYDLTGRTKKNVFENHIAVPQGNGEFSDMVTGTYTYTYNYFGDGREKNVVASGINSGNSTSTYDANKQRIKLDLGKGTGMERNEYSVFTYDNEGHILFKDHTSGHRKNTSRDRSYFYANGNLMGERGVDSWAVLRNEGIENAEFWEHMSKSVAGFDGPGYTKTKTGLIGMVENAMNRNGDLDYGLYNNIDATYPGANQSYLIRRGDTLQSIASAFYGNPSLWFVLADANGLSGSQPLQEGTQVKIPNTVHAGRITNDNHVVYSEGAITGSTLPSLVAPAPKGASNCQTIAMIVIIVAVAIVVSVVTAGAGAALAGLAVATLGATSTFAVAAVTVATFAVVGAVVAGVGSIVQQGLFMAAGLQTPGKLDWTKVGYDSLAGGLSGAAAGLGSWAKAAATAGKLSQASSSVVKVSAVALGIANNAVVQLAQDKDGDGGPDFKISSWTGIASAALSGYLNVSSDIASGTQVYNRMTGAFSASDAASDLSDAMRNMNYANQAVTPWLGLAETNSRQNGRLTPTDWASAAGATLAAAVPVATARVEQPIVQRLTNGALRFGTNMLVAGAVLHSDPDERAKFIANSIGQEVGQFIGWGIIDGARLIGAAIEKAELKRREEALAKAQEQAGIVPPAKQAAMGVAMGAAMSAAGKFSFAYTHGAGAGAASDETGRKARYDAFMENYSAGKPDSATREYNAWLGNEFGGSGMPNYDLSLDWDRPSLRKLTQQRHRAEYQAAVAAHKRAEEKYQRGMAATERMLKEMGLEGAYIDKKGNMQNVPPPWIPPKWDGNGLPDFLTNEPILRDVIARNGLGDGLTNSEMARIQLSQKRHDVAIRKMESSPHYQEIVRQGQTFLNPNATGGELRQAFFLTYAHQNQQFRDEEFSLRNVLRIGTESFGKAFDATGNMIGEGYRMATDWDYGYYKLAPVAAAAWHTPGALAGDVLTSTLDGMESTFRTVAEGSWQERSALGGTLLAGAVMSGAFGLTGLPAYGRGIAMDALRGTAAGIKSGLRYLSPFDDVGRLKPLARDMALALASPVTGVGGIGGGGFRGPKTDKRLGTLEGLARIDLDSQVRAGNSVVGPLSAYDLPPPIDNGGNKAIYVVPGHNGKPYAIGMAHPDVSEISLLDEFYSLKYLEDLDGFNPLKTHGFTRVGDSRPAIVYDYIPNAVNSKAMHNYIRVAGGLDEIWAAEAKLIKEGLFPPFSKNALARDMLVSVHDRLGQEKIGIVDLQTISGRVDGSPFGRPFLSDPMGVKDGPLGIRVGDENRRQLATWIKAIDESFGGNGPHGDISGAPRGLGGRNLHLARPTDFENEGGRLVGGGASVYVPRIDLADKFKIKYEGKSFLNRFKGTADKLSLDYHPAANHYNHAYVKGGVLRLSVKAEGDKLKFGGGKDMFYGLMNRLQREKVDVRAIEALWRQPDPYNASTNYDQYHANLAAGMSKEDAAMNTFTGIQARAFGFSNVQVRRAIVGGQPALSPFFTKPK